jgi:DNA primase
MPDTAFSRAQLDAIKQQSDLVAVVREQGIFLKRRGRTYFGLCPFHRSGRRRLA